MATLSLAPTYARAAHDGHTPRGYMKSYLGDELRRDVPIWRGSIWAHLGCDRNAAQVDRLRMGDYYIYSTFT